MGRHRRSYSRFNDRGVKAVEVDFESASKSHNTVKVSLNQLPLDKSTIEEQEEIINRQINNQLIFSDGTGTPDKCLQVADTKCVVQWLESAVNEVIGNVVINLNSKSSLDILYTDILIYHSITMASNNLTKKLNLMFNVENSNNNFSWNTVLIEEISKRLKLPDSNFAHYLNDGVPTGIINEIPATTENLFPDFKKKKKPHEPDELTLCSDCTLPDDEQQKIIGQMCFEELNKGYLKEVDENFIPVSKCKLTLITKFLPDGSIKYRIIEDHRRTGVNMNTKLIYETIILHTVKDVSNGIRQLVNTRRRTQFVACVMDIRNAYRLVPINESEKKYYYFEFTHLGKVYKVVRNVLPFGSISAPYLYVRSASLVFRILRLLHISRATGFQYIDDHLWIFTEKNASNYIAMNLVLGHCLGLRWALNKMQIGKRVTYIGYDLVFENQITIINSRQRVNDMINVINDWSMKSSIKTSDLESLIGKISFMLSVCPILRKKLSSYYTKVLIAQRLFWCYVNSLEKSEWQVLKNILKHLETVSIKVKTFDNIKCYTTDACNIGLAIVDMSSGNTIQQCRTEFVKEQNEKIKIELKCDDMINWEALAVASVSNDSVLSVIITDNEPTVRGSQKGYTLNSLHSVLCYMIWESQNIVVHMKGIHNVLADKASRSPTENDLVFSEVLKSAASIAEKFDLSI